MKSLILISFMLPMLASAEEIGFVHGNTRQIIALEGELIVLCPAGSEGATPVTAAYYCSELVMEPSPYDHFRGPRGLSASEVTLTAHREDGTTKSKTLPYDGRSLRTKESINLWISTLFQRPLLKEGRNKMIYTLIQGSTTVGQGEFEAIVQSGTSRQCPKTTYNSINPQDCISPYSVCQRYFSQYNNCKLQ
jgi:hypothetical protein